jgi:hypothetical protein
MTWPRAQALGQTGPHPALSRAGGRGDGEGVSQTHGLRRGLRSVARFAG